VLGSLARSYTCATRHTRGASPDPPALRLDPSLIAQSFSCDQVLESAVGPARTYEDVEAALSGGWPSREAIFEGIETPIEHEKRRFFGLTWCKTKSVSSPLPVIYTPSQLTSRIEFWAHPGRGASTPPTRASRPRVTRRRWPSAPTTTTSSRLTTTSSASSLATGGLMVRLGLLAQLVCRWTDAPHPRISYIDGTLLLTTSLPFETSDGDDRAATAVGEMCVKSTCAGIRLILSRRYALRADPLRRVEQSPPRSTTRTSAVSPRTRQTHSGARSSCCRRSSISGSSATCVPLLVVSADPDRPPGSC
jgi:hypothetical protein